MSQLSDALVKLGYLKPQHSNDEFFTAYKRFAVNWNKSHGAGEQVNPNIDPAYNEKANSALLWLANTASNQDRKWFKGHVNGVQATKGVEKLVGEKEEEPEDKINKYKQIYNDLTNPKTISGVERLGKRYENYGPVGKTLNFVGLETDLVSPHVGTMQDLLDKASGDRRKWSHRNTYDDTFRGILQSTTGSTQLDRASIERLVDQAMRRDGITEGINALKSSEFSQDVSVPKPPSDTDVTIVSASQPKRQRQRTTNRVETDDDDAHPRRRLANGGGIQTVSYTNYTTPQSSSGDDRLEYGTGFGKAGGDLRVKAAQGIADSLKTDVRLARLMELNDIDLGPKGSDGKLGPKTKSTFDALKEAGIDLYDPRVIAALSGADRDKNLKEMLDKAAAAKNPQTVTASTQPQPTTPAQGDVAGIEAIYRRIDPEFLKRQVGVNISGDGTTYVPVTLEALGQNADVIIKGFKDKKATEVSIDFNNNGKIENGETLTVADAIKAVEGLKKLVTDQAAVQVVGGPGNARSNGTGQSGNSIT